MNFEEIKKQALEEYERFEAPGEPRVLIGSATCGRAAGALEVMEVFKEELHDRGKADEIKMVEVGCHGLCYAEPLV